MGGYGNLLGQIFRRNFPNYSAGFSLNITFRNRAAQADYVTDQLSLRQSQLQYQKAVSQVRVDVKNAVIGLQQARARYETAVATRALAQQTLEAEQNRFQFGESTIATVVQAQRDLASDQSAEIQAMANYTHAKRRVRRSRGADAGCQWHLDGRSGGGAGGERIVHCRLSCADGGRTSDASSEKLFQYSAPFGACWRSQCSADSQVVEKPHGPLLVRSYRPPRFRRWNLKNSDQLHSSDSGRKACT